MVRNIRNMFLRANLTETEVKTLHGIVKELRWGRRPDRPPYQGTQKPAEVGEEALAKAPNERAAKKKE